VIKSKPIPRSQREGMSTDHGYASNNLAAASNRRIRTRKKFQCYVLVPTIISLSLRKLWRIRLLESMVLGRLIEAGEYFVPEPPEVIDYNLVNNPYGLNKATYLEQQKLYMRHWEDMINNRIKLYAPIWQYLSQESIA
jgi:hypothetical protein